MNCEQAHELITMAVYGEAADVEMHELEVHMRECVACCKQWREVAALKVLAEAYPVQEPNANLVARSRLRLEEALDALPPRSCLVRLRQRFVNGFAGLGAVPLAASALLLAGVAAGAWGGYRLAPGHDGPPPMRAGSPPPPPPGMAPGEPGDPGAAVSISSIVRRPGGQAVEIVYNQVAPRRVEGSLDDPAIRQLLMLASANADSQDVRDNSVDLMAAECRAGHSCKPAGIRDALIMALRSDKSAGVREKALKGLASYVAEDMRVRDAVLAALLYDPSAHIRAQAIGILEPVEADTSVRQALHAAANSDQSSQIRSVSRQILSRAPVTQ
jgi:hypothetical protein